MRDMARQVAMTWLEQRKELEYPLLKEHQLLNLASSAVATSNPPVTDPRPADFVMEIGVEELPASDPDSAIQQLKVNVPRFLVDLTSNMETLPFPEPRAGLAVMVASLAPHQPDRSDLVKGPAAERAFGAGRSSRPRQRWVCQE